MSVVGNSKLVYETKYANIYKTIVKDYNANYKKNNDKVVTILDNLLEKNNNYIDQIYNSKNSIKNYEKMVSKKELIVKDIENEIIKNNTINLEKDTFIVLSKEKNKNIEIYYIVYILFSVLLLIIEGSVILFK